MHRLPRWLKVDGSDYGSERGRSRLSGATAGMTANPSFSSSRPQLAATRHCLVEQALSVRTVRFVRRGADSGAYPEPRKDADLQRACSPPGATQIVWVLGNPHEHWGEACEQPRIRMKLGPFAPPAQTRNPHECWNGRVIPRTCEAVQTPVLPRDLASPGDTPYILRQRRAPTPKSRSY